MKAVETMATAAANRKNSRGRDMSLELASRLFDWSSIALAIGACIVFVATAAIVWLGIVKEHHWDLLREHANEKIAAVGLEAAKANAELGAAQADIAKANAQIAAANEVAAKAHERAAALVLKKSTHRSFLSRMNGIRCERYLCWVKPCTVAFAP